ncbi:MAG: UDP-N-acetylmuramate dehydrogenase [Deltaproteobacteria bacterium]|nr:UDP-N-acetylmuramate dehydrogenase [Deltaproteobacteria bacterium]MBW2050679.1 UDP-N-acetylmuramate dehydrogenase [Deltaproteobacteria bacterium]MBW2139597.1 UDP-N-acetylmuramate dehydrogenase [Deltaproteobacteria bacterium]MBW2323281.1 UDP-N-acetylmuramate dehydrogenase [Deltaproteobacteria bacterium]
MRLDQLAPGHVKFDEPLAHLTTFGLGGPADALVEPDSISELSEVLRFARNRRMPLFLLAAGSNVLFRDGGFPGVVVKLGPGFSKLDVLGSDGDRVTVEAGAAVSIGSLIKFLQKEGLSGLEFLAGIPGTVGGALAMNAGAFGGEISDLLHVLHVLDADGQVKKLSQSQISASYRHLDLPDGSIIVKAMFILTRSTTGQVKEKIRGYLGRRWTVQPTGVKSAGSIFKNPSLEPAGKLIDQAGLKGRSIGRAWVSEKHANFIVHRGEACAGDVIQLIDLVQSEVRKKFGVELEPEIIIEGVDREADPK